MSKRRGGCVSRRGVLRRSRRFGETCYFRVVDLVKKVVIVCLNTYKIYFYNFGILLVD